MDTNFVGAVGLPVAYYVVVTVWATFCCASRVEQSAYCASLRAVTLSHEYAVVLCSRNVVIRLVTL
jgi:hypothetical protein